MANEQARIVTKTLFADSPEKIPDCVLGYVPDYGAVPKVVFTAPCLASDGIFESKAKEQYPEANVRYEQTSTRGSVRKTAIVCAAYKLFINKTSDQLLGAYRLGPTAEETINLFALAMKFRLTATDLKSTPFAFPTFAADVRRML